MNDTPKHINDLQQKLWLAKPPMERLSQFLKDNEQMNKFWREVKSVKKDDTKKLHKTIIQ